MRLLYDNGCGSRDALPATWEQPFLAHHCDNLVAENMFYVYTSHVSNTKSLENCHHIYIWIVDFSYHLCAKNNAENYFQQCSSMVYRVNKIKCKFLSEKILFLEKNVLNKILREKILRWCFRHVCDGFQGNFKVNLIF